MNEERKSSTETIEEAYFHTGNSGLTARIIEHTSEGRASDRIYYSHHLEIVHGAMGHSTSISSPILSREMISIYIDMLARARDRMDALPQYRDAHRIRTEDAHRAIRVRNGCKLEEVWSPEIIDSEWSTSSHFLGHNLRKNGEIVAFEPYQGKEIARGSGSCGNSGKPTYRFSDIGKLVEDVERDQQRLEAENTLTIGDAPNNATTDWSGVTLSSGSKSSVNITTDKISTNSVVSDSLKNVQDMDAALGARITNQETVISNSAKAAQDMQTALEDLQTKVAELAKKK